jgi:phospholipid/cholesterol/gamma-HCH transport system ATP-binding protein
MAIEFRDLHKALGGRPILRGVDLVAPTQEISFIIGPSGAGKSVTARHAAGLLRPDRGEVYVLGERVDHLPERELARVRKGCAFVLQGSALLDGLDLRGNVALGGRARGLRRKQSLELADALLERCGLAALRLRWPSECGPGVLMRAAVARALALEPRMIIYDEPTSGLDPAAARQLDALIVETNAAGIGALVISHDLVAIMTIADSVHLLHEGRILLAGPPRLFAGSPDPVVRQFIDGKADGPLPEW